MLVKFQDSIQINTKGFIIGVEENGLKLKFLPSNILASNLSCMCVSPPVLDLSSEQVLVEQLAELQLRLMHLEQLHRSRQEEVQMLAAYLGQILLTPSRHATSAPPKSKPPPSSPSPTHHPRSTSQRPSVLRTSPVAASSSRPAAPHSPPGVAAPILAPPHAASIGFAPGVLKCKAP
jgi:hypothetical protein